METYRKQKRFYQRWIDEWVACGCRTKAMRKVRPKAKRPKELAYALLRRRPELLQAFEERKAEAIESVKDQLVATVQGAANRANARRRGIFGPDNKLLKPDQWPEELDDCIEGMEFDAAGNVTKLRLAPRNEATRLFLEYLKVMVKRNSLEGPDGKPLPTGVARLMIVTDEEAKKLDAELDAEV